MESNWEWSLAHPLHDVEDIVHLADHTYSVNMHGIMDRDPAVFRHRVTVATTEQLFNKGKELIAVCRGPNQVVPLYDANMMLMGHDTVRPLLGFCWFDRGGYTTYSNEEISNAKFHHVDLSLPVRTRIRLIDEMIDQHILWAAKYGVPVVCSTSIRSDYEGFMKIHKRRGFTVNGSYAWIRTEDGIKCLTK